MPLALKVKKLRRMSAHELKSRVGDYVRLQRERKNFPQELRRVSEDAFNFFAESHAPVFRTLLAGALPMPFDAGGWMRRLPIPFGPERAWQFREQFPCEFERSCARAQRILEHRFAFLGIEVHYPSEIKWHADPVSGKTYPRDFYRDIDIFSDSEPTDIKHVWELNRLQFLIELAKAYYLTGEDKYRQELERLVAHWHAQNPYKTGVAWTSALEVAVRAFSFFWTLNFLLAAPAQTPRTVFLLLKLLYLSGRFIDENLSIYFSPYNHLIGEVAALHMIGYLFPGFADAGKWARKSWEILQDQVGKQFHRDGGTVEQATFYHHFTLGFYLQCVVFRRLNGDSSGFSGPAGRRDRLQKALEFALQMTRPDGTLPWIGDIDAARSLYFSEPAHWNFTGFQAIGAALFRRSDMKFLAGGLSEEAHWLLPEPDRTAFERLPAEKPARKSIHLPHAGYCVLRSGWNRTDHYSLIDCGPVAAGLFSDGTPSAAHGHADVLAIELAPFGEPLLIDPGFSNYRGDFNWHRYFRSTAAHNTIELDEQSQLVQKGLLNWACAPAVSALQVYDTALASGFCGEHFGYRRLPDQPVHRRYFLFIENTFWVVLDYLYASAGETTPPHLIKHHFHFSEHARVAWQADLLALRAEGERARLEIILLGAPAAAETSLRCGGPNPEDGWICPTYRDRRQAPVAAVAFRQHLPARLCSIYLPSLADDPLVRLHRATAGEAVLSVAEHAYRIRLLPGTAGDEVLRISLAHRGRTIVCRAPARASRNGNLKNQELLPIQDIEEEQGES